jgi:hypothetical protein
MSITAGAARIAEGGSAVTETTGAARPKNPTAMPRAIMQGVPVCSASKFGTTTITRTVRVIAMAGYRDTGIVGGIIGKAFFVE